MPVAVMQVGHVRMLMDQGFVHVFVRVRPARTPREFVAVLVMCVVHMGMRVAQGFMRMQVIMMFGHVQPCTDQHQ